MDAAWTRLRAEIASTLATLQDDGWLMVAEPDPSPVPSQPPRRGLFRRRKQPQVVTRYVQWRSTPDGFICECIGDDAWTKRSWPGWPLTPEQDKALRAQGWTPELIGTPARQSYGNYRMDLPPDAAERAADVGVEALRILDLAPDTPWEWVHEHP